MQKRVISNGLRHFIRGAAALMFAAVTAQSVQAELGAFNLLAPGTDGEPGAVVSDPATVESFTWTPSSGAESYIFYPRMTTAARAACREQIICPGL